MWDDESPEDHEPREECLMVDIIAARKATGKFFYRYGFGENLSSVPQKRLTPGAAGQHEDDEPDDAPHEPLVLLLHARRPGPVLDCPTRCWQSRAR